MPDITPTALEQLPLGIIKATFGNGNCVVVVDLSLPIVDDSLRSLVPIPDKNKQYHIVTIPDSAHSINGKTYTIDNKKISIESKTTVDLADAKFIEIALSKTGNKIDSGSSIGLSDAKTKK